MVSTLIVFPEDGSVLDRRQENIIRLSTRNLVAGFFSDANLQYYLAPQTLDNGLVQGHQHVTIQKLDGGKVPDPRIFAFFKGINEEDVDGVLEAAIPAGFVKENGLFRICSLTGAFTHQPVVSPVQIRGPQDDCIRVTFSS